MASKNPTPKYEVLTPEQVLLSRTVLDEVKQIVNSGRLVPEGDEETSYFTRVALALVARNGNGEFALSERERCVAAKWIAFSVAKSFVVARPFLPTEWATWCLVPYEVGDVDFDELRECCEFALYESLLAKNANPDTARSAVSIARRAMEQALPRDAWQAKDNKSLPKEEIVDVDYRKGTAELLDIEDIEIDDVPSEFPQPKSPFRGDFVEAVRALFDVVKQQHKYAPAKRYRCFEYFVLNLRNKDIAELLAISKQKASANNVEFCRWLLDAVKSLDAKHLTVLRRYGLKL